MNRRSQSYCFGIITFFCLLPLPNTSASPTRSLCRRDQRDALLEIQKEFPFNDYWRVPLWNKSGDCCSWYGVTCDAMLGEVISLELKAYATTGYNISWKSISSLFKLHHLRHLDLSGCNLQGEIPSLIGNLSHLTHLDLSYNQLEGEVPSSIGNLYHLTHLDLSKGNLQGEIPSSIGNLSHLTYLNLSRNQLVGEVPASIGNLNRLESIKLKENHLGGNIPTSFSNLTKLYNMDLSKNQFTGGIIVLSNLTSLSNIDLSSNHFQSSISADLSGLHNLERFLVYGNSFVGPFPSSLLMISSLVEIYLSQNQFEGHLDFGNTSSSSRLRHLDVGYNGFDGVIPESISKLVNLENLYLSHNNFLGRVPSSISKLVNVDLSYNKFEGQVPHCLWRSSKLEYVKLSHNSFSSFEKSVEAVDGESLGFLDLGSNLLHGPFPQWICKFRSLGDLDLSNNHFTGSIPQCLKNFTALQSLFLRNNSLRGFLPDVFTNFNTSLDSFDVSNNNLVGKLPNSLVHCERLSFLNVKGNKIKDTFPFWLGSLPSLKILLLRSNAFYGPVYNPSAYLGFERIRIVDISNNNFDGSLPQDYFANWIEISKRWKYGSYGVIERPSSAPRNSMDLVYKGVDMNFALIFNDLKIIDFSGNRFSGDIPGSIGVLTDFRHLNFSGNAFTGDIPASLANITNLESLDLSRNNLSGEIPQGLGNLSFLSNINFSYNHLQGMVPRSTQFQRQNCSSFVGNPELYGLEDICGESLHVLVPTSHQPDDSFSEPEEPVLNWIAAAIAFGPGLFCGLVIGHIFTSYKYQWFIAR